MGLHDLGHFALDPNSGFSDCCLVPQRSEATTYSSGKSSIGRRVMPRQEKPFWNVVGFISRCGQSFFSSEISFSACLYAHVAVEFVLTVPGVPNVYSGGCSSVNAFDNRSKGPGFISPKSWAVSNLK